MTDIAKQITSDVLEDGGKLGPSQAFGLSGLEVGDEPTYPDKALQLTPPELADKLIAGELDLIVRPQRLDIANQTLLLLKQGKALGVVKVGERTEVTKEDFPNLEARHRVSQAMLKDWGEAQPSWLGDKLNAWPVSVLIRFVNPLATDAVAGPDLVVTGVKVETGVKKIKDVETYDPSKAEDPQLRDDFRILLAWYATRQKNPKDFPYSLETIETLLRKVLLELVRRGPEVIRFNPAGMAESVRPFFQQVARDVKVPQAMFKALSLAVDTEPGELTPAELKEAHWKLHEMFDLEADTQRGVQGWSTEDIVNLHSRVVDELYSRKIPHPPPPDNGLDELSGDFERHAGEQPKWYEIQRVRKGEFAVINRSGNKLGRKITLDEVLPHFRTFKMRVPYVCLVGGLANHGETEGDIDILVNDSVDTPEWMRDVIEFRVGRALPTELSKRVQVHYDRDRGPFTNFVELYDLRLERVNSTNEIKEMRDKVNVKEKLESMKNVVKSVEELAAFFRSGSASP